jgi:hypothetical protein
MKISSSNLTITTHKFGQRFTVNSAATVLNQEIGSRRQVVTRKEAKRITKHLQINSMDRIQAPTVTPVRSLRNQIVVVLNTLFKVGLKVHNI